MSLQLRNAVVLTTMAVNVKVPVNYHSSDVKMSGLEDPEAVRMLAGTVRWCLDLMSWIVDQLLFPPDPLPGAHQSLDTLSLTELNDYLRSANTVALHLLLASSTRGFLIAICRRLAHLDYTARKAMSSAAQAAHSQPGQAGLVSNSLRASYTAIATLTQEAIVPVRHFEAFVTNIAGLVKDTYLAHNLPVQERYTGLPGEVNRNSIEAQVLFGGPLPETYKLAIGKLFSDALPKLRGEIDTGLLFFHDFSALHLPLSDDTLLGRETRDGERAAANAALAAHRRAANAEKRVRYTVDIFGRRRAELPAQSEKRDGAKVGNVVGSGNGNVNGKRWRRCVRCAAVMEDLTSKAAVIQFLVMQQRRCCCAGGWYLLPGGVSVP